MARAARGDQNALAILFERYHRLICSIATRILRDPQEGEDVSQSVFAEICTAAPKFNPHKGSVRSWLLQYAYHRSFNRKKYLNFRGYYDLSASTAGIPGFESPELWKGLTATECRRLIRQAFETLSPEQKTTLEMAVFEGYRLSEIADRLDVSPGNVRHYYYRGLERLRRFIEEQGHE